MKLLFTLCFTTLLLQASSIKNFDYETKFLTADQQKNIKFIISHSNDTDAEVTIKFKDNTTLKQHIYLDSNDKLILKK